MINIFRYLDYRVYLADNLLERKGTSRELKNAELAKQMRVQASYLSRILQKNTHANADQLYLACKALELSTQETDYLLLLLDWARTNLPERKAPLKKKILALQEAKRGSDQVLQAEFVRPETTSQLNEYYLDPIISILHSCLSIPKYQTHPELLAHTLGISELRLKEILELLIRLDIIALEPKKNSYRVIKTNVHLDRKSVLNQAYQTLFRHTSIEHLRRISSEDQFRFAATVSADEQSIKAIHDEFNQFLGRIEKIVRDAPSEGSYQINFDLFRWDPKY